MVLTGSSCTQEAEAEGSMQIKGQPTVHSKLQAGGSCTWEDFMEEPGCVLRLKDSEFSKVKAAEAYG